MRTAILLPLAFAILGCNGAAEPAREEADKQDGQQTGAHEVLFEV